jgi:hypothetical protein
VIDSSTHQSSELVGDETSSEGPIHSNLRHELAQIAPGPMRVGGTGEPPHQSVGFKKIFLCSR